MQIIVINEHSPHLEVIKKLWRLNSATLGFFPEGAFLEYARRKNIIAAVDENNTCCGYLIYRTSRYRATIVHLCIANEYRGKGITRDLVKFLCQTTKDLYGIGLKCRRDFPAHSVWPKLGFIAQDDFPGRGKAKNELTYYWLDHGHPNLFTPEIVYENQKLYIVIDANILIDFYTDTDCESAGLLSDAFKDYISIYLTDEIRNELHRQEGKEQRQAILEFSDQYPLIPYDKEKYKNSYSLLRPMFPLNLSDNDKSDLIHLAKTIAGDFKFFVTRDNDLLLKHQQIYEHFGLSILCPSDIITYLDELLREAEYQPSRLSGTTVSFQRLQSNSHLSLPGYFQCPGLNERKGVFLNTLKSFSSQPDLYTCNVVSDQGQIPIALIVYDRSNENYLNIPIIRISTSVLAPTVIRNILFQAVHISAQEKRLFIKITEPYLHPSIKAALSELGFTELTNEFVKINLAMADYSDKITEYIKEISNSFEINYRDLLLHFAKLLSDKNLINDTYSISKIERRLWPLKILDANIPSFILSIKAIWAEYLFDTGLAEQNLFGVDPGLALNNESVYYRSARNSRGLSAPARILWYISSDKNYSGAKAIRVCSYLNSVLVDKPKFLYKQYKYLGVYEWKHINNLVKDNTNTDIMAIKFDLSETLSYPINYAEVKGSLDMYDIRSPLQAPIPIPSNLFGQLYNMGKFQKEGL